jgi:hypothetical protein
MNLVLLPSVLFTALAITASASADFAVAQASTPPPAQTAPAPTPSPSAPVQQQTPPPTAQQIPPPAAAEPTVPVIPKNPDELHTLLTISKEETDLQKQIQDFLTKGNKQLQDWQAQMQAYDKIAQDEITDIKKKEGWGPEVRFNPQTGKFEKPLKLKPEAAAGEKK